MAALGLRAHRSQAHSACAIGKPMRARRPNTSNIERLRVAIDCMPVATRKAMLAGVRANERIIVGAYVDGRGGVCPMLAAHRAERRTTSSRSRGPGIALRGRAAGRASATERELRSLMLLSSNRARRRRPGSGRRRCERRAETAQPRQACPTKAGGSGGPGGRDHRATLARESAQQAGGRPTFLGLRPPDLNS